MTRRIFVSCTIEKPPTPRERHIRKAITDSIKNEGFVAESIADQTWSRQTCLKAMKKCQGVVLIGLSRSPRSGRSKPIELATPLLYCEGILAREMRLPILAIVDQGVTERGVIKRPLRIPERFVESWTRTPTFNNRLQNWRKKLKSRHDVFLGYCSDAKEIADSVANHLKSKGLRVRNWNGKFRAGYDILGELKRASHQCSCAIFVFSQDDRLLETKQEVPHEQKAPRDNVVFEAGYFIQARGLHRVLILREGATKMPADLQARIYKQLPIRSELTTAHVEKAINPFIKNCSILHRASKGTKPVVLPRTGITRRVGTTDRVASAQ